MSKKTRTIYKNTLFAVLSMEMTVSTLLSTTTYIAVSPSQQSAFSGPMSKYDLHPNSVVRVGPINFTSSVDPTSLRAGPAKGKYAVRTANVSKSSNTQAQHDQNDNISVSRNTT